MAPRADHASLGAAVDTTAEGPETRSGPLLKWAGGKRQLLPQLRRFYPRSFGRYIEPFLGSGAVFFDLFEKGLLRNRDVLLVDSNADLIGCYETVRDSPEAVAAALAELADARARLGQSHYYEVRDARFNPARALLRAADGRIAYTPALAAMFIYLNRTGFNGLFRVNASGEFNVPAGRYANPRILDRSRLHRVSQALSGRHVRLIRASFDLVDSVAEGGDFLYIDPPYAPLSTTSNFTAYTPSRFSSDDQERLQQLTISLAGRGSLVLLSNSTAPEITALYERNPAARRAGIQTFRVPARRLINRNAAGRGPIDELLITNIAPSDVNSTRPPPSDG